MNKGKKALFALYRFVCIFVLIAFVVTCSFLLFLRSMNLDVELLRRNALATFLNVIFLTFILCLIDALRRKFIIERPVRRITKSLNKITSGDFSEKIEPVVVPLDSEFNPIIECINVMTKELSNVETLKTDFIANVSHELKTPLSIIQNYTTMLSMPDLTDEKKNEYISSIRNTSIRLSNLITNILKLSKLENQQIFSDMEIKKYNLGEQLCECLLNYESIIESKNIDVVSDIDDDVYIEADYELLSLVWNNLFSNAVKFTGNGGKISILLKSDNDSYIIRVSDTGCGISNETGKHIFEKFYQGDTSHSSQGNGLGLALVKRVIDIIHGEISVESQLGEGSTFTVIMRKSNEY